MIPGIYILVGKGLNALRRIHIFGTVQVYRESYGNSNSEARIMQACCIDQKAKDLGKKKLQFDPERKA